jgi:predicted pyridoxine 5'-phosphate oxidase superfamily flavin-nucleotide-binding protein
MSMIERVEQLEALYGTPLETATAKEVDHITPEYARFIEESP